MVTTNLFHEGERESDLDIFIEIWQVCFASRFRRFQKEHLFRSGLSEEGVQRHKAAL